MLEDNEFEPTWRNILRLADVPWIQDHKVINDIIFPAAGYVSMAGEAIRQLTGTEDFSLRNVFIKTALVLRDLKATEMMTSLRRMRLTTVLDSDWYELSISSYNGTSWMKHCIGEVRAGREQTTQPEEISTLPRNFPATVWYSAMKRMGLNYGPAFQGLTDISASPNSGTAVASLVGQHGSGDSIYQVHPTTIDLCLQLFTVGMAEGTTRRLQKLCVPTEIEEIYIRRGIPEVRAKVTASSSVSGMIKGDAVAIAGQHVVIHLRGGKFSPLEDQVPSDNYDSIAGAQLLWKPHIDFLQADKLMRPRMSLKDEVIKLERLALLCILETRHQLLDVNTRLDHLKKFETWLNQQADRAENGAYALIEDAQAIAHLTHKERLESIETASTEVGRGVGGTIGKILLRILQQCKAIFEEQVDAIEILLQEDGLRILYDFFQDMWDCHELFGLLGHVKPTLRILEIGAGTGGTTASVVKDLVTASGERMYSRYCYTDISASFFIAAKERFKDYQNIQYAVLDICKDPIEQGFVAESYDLILASNVGLLQLRPSHCSRALLRFFTLLQVLDRPFLT